MTRGNLSSFTGGSLECSFKERKEPCENDTNETAATEEVEFSKNIIENAKNAEFQLEWD